MRHLRELLREIGLAADPGGPPAPRLSALPDGCRDDVLALYRSLGGTHVTPALRPGPWDLATADGVLIELDEELHFNRFRLTTLQPPWTYQLPWRAAYVSYCSRHEGACLSAAKWGKRWTSPSSESLFGTADRAGQFTDHGAPRWKQRALYDAMKDAAVLGHSSHRLARLATVDLVGGVRLGDVLERRAPADLWALEALVQERLT